MYRMDRNNYIKNPKNSTVYTPQIITDNIWRIVAESGLQYNTVLDPSVGTGNLINHLQVTKVVGADIEDHEVKLDQFIQKPFEDTTYYDYQLIPDLVVANPPFNGCKGKKLYSRVFIQHIQNLFGKIPMVVVTPYTLRLNLVPTGRHWDWQVDNLDITGILSLPKNIFVRENGKKVLFHIEILFINFPKRSIDGHYFLEK